MVHLVIDTIFIHLFTGIKIIMQVYTLELNLNLKR